MLPTWDYATDLRLERTVELDVGAIRDATDLPASAPLALGALWASDTHLRGAGSIAQLEGGPNVSVTLEFPLEGWNLGEVLTLDTDLFLLEDLDDIGGPTAFRAGSRLWSQRSKVRLQGGAARFPLALVDPVLFGFSEHTPWFLEIRPELDTPTLGGLHLLINENNALVRAAVESPSAVPESDPIMSMLAYDIGRILVEFALEHDEIGAEHHDEGTIGYSLRSLLARTFPGESPKEVRNRRISDPAGFAADVAGALRLLSRNSS